MKQRLLILIALILVSDTSRGQHCAFEDVSIIVVWIHTKDDSSNIPDLKITLVDSQGNTISDRNNNEIVFRKNKEKNQHNGYFLSPESDKYYLCRVYNDREYIASGNRLYKPVEIILD